MKKSNFTRLSLTVMVFTILLTGCSEGKAADSKSTMFKGGHAAYESESNTSAEEVVASYNGENVTRETVEYWQKMNSLNNQAASEAAGTTVETTERTFYEELNAILRSMVLYDEAIAQGYAASDEEIEEMMNNTVTSYSIPQGKELLDDYCAGRGITFEEYLDMLREQAPETIARQKLKLAIKEAYCKEHGTEYTNVNPPQEALDAVDDYIDELMEKHEDEIIYYVDEEGNAL